MIVSSSYIQDGSVCFFLLPYSAHTLTRVTLRPGEPAIAETVNLPRRKGYKLRREPDLLPAAKALYESLRQQRDRRVFSSKTVRAG